MPLSLGYPKPRHKNIDCDRNREKIPAKLPQFPNTFLLYYILTDLSIAKSKFLYFFTILFLNNIIFSVFP